MNSRMAMVDTDSCSNRLVSDSTVVELNMARPQQPLMPVRAQEPTRPTKLTACNFGNDHPAPLDHAQQFREVMVILSLSLAYFCRRVDIHTLSLIVVHINGDRLPFPRGCGSGVLGVLRFDHDTFFDSQLDDQALDEERNQDDQ